MKERVYEWTVLLRVVVWVVEMVDGKVGRKVSLLAVERVVLMVGR